MEEEYLTCDDNTDFELWDYFYLLSEGPYEEQRKEDKVQIIDSYEHIKNCDSCREAHKILERVFESERGLLENNYFSDSEKDMIKRNEKYLESILIQ